MSPTPVRVVVGLLLVALPILLVRCGIGDLVNPGEGGRLTVSSGALVQSAAVGSQALRTATVDITSASGRAVGWSAQRAQGGAWLSLTPTAGTVPSTVTVSFDPAGLGVGEFRDTLVVRADGSDAEPLRVPVTFTIAECELTPVTPGGGGAIGTLSAADCGAPNRADHFARVYTFAAVAGDSITVVLSSTAFDPYLVIATAGEAAPVAATGAGQGGGEVGGDGRSGIRESGGLLVESADCLFSPNDACLVNVLVPEDGTYLIEVTTEQAGATGAFSLGVAPPRDPMAPGLGGLGVGQFQVGGIVQIPQGEGLAGTEGVFKGRMDDADPFDSLRLEVEAELVGTPFDDTPTATGAMVANGDTASVGISGLADAASYHWQARAVDNTGRAGPWMAFGTNGDPDGVDFITVVSRLPDLPTALAQARTDGTPIAVGAPTPERQVGISASVSDPDGDDVRIEVEVKPVGTDFDGTPSGVSGAVASGGTATATVGGLVDGLEYRWRVRTADENSLFSDWVEFGGNGDEADFVVDVGASGVDPGQSTVESDVTSISSDGGVATITVTVVSVLGEPVVGAAVALSATGGGNTITQPANTDASGETSGTLSSTGAGDKVVTAVADGVTITETATITVTPGAADAGQTTAAVPDGTAGNATTITVTVRDANGNQLDAGNEMVVVSVTGANTATPTVTDNDDGTYTASYTPSAVGTDAVAITLNGAEISGSPYSSMVSSGVADPSETTADVPDGTAGSATVITVTTADANGNPLTTGGQTVVVDITGANTATPTVTDHNDGTYSATYTPTAAGDDLVEVTLNGTEISGSPYTSVVSPATGNLLSITTQPSATAQSGVAFDQQPVIQLRDEFDNPVNQSGVEVTALIFSGGGTLVGDNAVETDGSGVATFTDLGISGLVGQQRILTFVASGFASVNSSAIDLTAGPVSAGQSTVSASPGTITTDDETTITVTALDGAGNPVEGVTVTFSSTGSENTFNPTSPTTNAGGVATTQFSSTMPEGKTITAVADGVTITQTAAVTVETGGVDADESTVAADVTTISADGGVATITVTARDANQNPIAGLDVVLAANPDDGTLTQPAATTNASGEATGTLASTVLGDKVVSAMIDGVGVTQMVTITVEAGGVDAGESTVAADVTTISADGGVATITVTARDANQNPIAGLDVVLAANPDDGTLTQPAATTNASGEATGTLASTVLGDKVVSAMIDGVGVTQMVTITVEAGGVDAGESTVAADVTTISADGGVATITVTARDANQNPIAGLDVVLAANPDDGTLTQPAATTNASGEATGTLASTVLGDKVVSAMIDGVGVTQMVTITVEAGGVDAGESTVEADVTTISADGGVATITVTARDANQNPIAGLDVVLAANPDDGTLTQPGATTNASGEATGTLASAVPGDKVVSATIDAVAITEMVTVTVEAGAVSTAQSTIIANPTTIMTGLDTSVITVTALDANDNPIEGATVVLSTMGGTATSVEQPVSTTDAAGQTTGRVSSLALVEEDIVVSAEIDGVLIDQTATVTVAIVAAAANGQGRETERSLAESDST